MIARHITLQAGLCIALLGQAAAAAPEALKEESTEISFPSQTTVGDATYQCLGTGVRKLLFLKVYAMTFCLEAGHADAVVQSAVSTATDGKSLSEIAAGLEHNEKFFDALATAPGGKLVTLHLVRDVNAARLASAFRDSLANVLPPAKIETLVSTIPGDAHKDQLVQIFSDHNDVTTIDIDGARKTVKDADIAQNIWRVWLGPKSVAPSLKKSIAHNAAAAVPGV